VLNQLKPLLENYPKPVTALFLGQADTVPMAGVNTVNTLGELISVVGQTPMEIPPKLPAIEAGRFLRGLFVGGTLAIQASVILDIPLSSEGLRPWDAAQHVLVDLGDDRFTVGRPHPMIDGTGRGEALQEVLADPRTGLVVGDIVLGDGAESDPALPVLTAIQRAAMRRETLPPVVFTVVGTRQDPQNYDSQVARLLDAGVWVTQTSTAAILAIKQALGRTNA
jgi:FdrA protein